MNLSERLAKIAEIIPDGARVADAWWLAKSRCRRDCASCGLCRRVLAEALVDCEALEGEGEVRP